MTDPRTPESKQEEAQLPDPLDQVPGSNPDRGRHGSEDAQLLAEAGREEGDVERETAPQDDLAND